MLSKVFERVSVSIGSPPLGNMEARSFLRDFKIKSYIKRSIKMSCRRVSLAIAAPFGNPEGDRFTRRF